MSVDIDLETEILRDRLEELERGAATLEQWRTLDMQVFAALLDAQVQLVSQQRIMIERVKAGKQDWSWVRSHTRVNDLIALINELHLLRLTVQSRITETRATVGSARAD